MDKITVIIPNYLHQKYLMTAIQSILSLQIMKLDVPMLRMRGRTWLQISNARNKSEFWSQVMFKKVVNTYLKGVK